MIETQKIKVGEKQIDALSIRLQSKSLILLRGDKGYVMCGYLNLEAAEKFNDVAVLIKGVSDINDAVNASVHSCTSAAKKAGIFEGQPIKEVLKIIV